MKQNIRANWILMLAILVIMLMMSTVVNYAVSIMSTDSSGADVSEYQEDFYKHLFAMATYNEMTGANLSYEDFASLTDKSGYEAVFDMLNKQSGTALSVDSLEAASSGLEASGIEIATYIKQFEYIYALGKSEGCFSGDALDVENMMNTMLTVMGVPLDIVKNIGSMDMTAMLNRLYFTVIGLLPIFLLIVILANYLLADQVDKGSLAYVLSTPTKRSAVVITQGLFMVLAPLLLLTIVCVQRIATTYLFFDEVNIPKIVSLYIGMYVLVEAVAGICYLGSCWFNRSKHALAFGGGLTVWFFLASLLGMFGSENLVDMGVGVEALGRFNYMTLVGLYDIDAISTVGTDAVDYGFVWKLSVLVLIAIACYVTGAIKFNKKDLPL